MCPTATASYGEAVRKLQNASGAGGCERTPAIAQPQLGETTRRSALVDVAALEPYLQAVQTDCDKHDEDQCTNRSEGV
jgi:hypothetical protein